MSQSRLLLIAALVGVVIFACPVGNRCHAQNSTTDSQGEPQRASDPIPPTDLAAINDRLESITRALETLKAEPDADEKRRAEGDLKAQEDMAFWAMLMTIATALSVAVSTLGVGLLLVTLRQNRGAIRIALAGLKRTNQSVRIAERQLIADSRPWIKVDALIPASPLRFVKDGNGHIQGTLDVTLTLSNIGKTPALRVLAYTKFNASPFGGTAKLRDQFADILNNRATSTATIGETLFPDDSSRGSHTLTMTSSEIGRALKHFKFPGKAAIAPDILICIAYDMPSTSKTHETGLVFHLSRSVGSSNLIEVEFGEIAREHLILSRTIVGGCVT